MQNREVDHVMEAAYTVRQLIEQLESLDPEDRVFFVCSYGDYHNTQQAIPVGEVIDGLTTNDLTDTPYSHSGVCLIEDQDSDEQDSKEDDESFGIVVFRN